MSNDDLGQGALTSERRTVPRIILLCVFVLVVIAFSIFAVFGLGYDRHKIFGFGSFYDDNDKNNMSDVTLELADSFSNEAKRCAELDPVSLLEQAESCHEVMVKQPLTTLDANNSDTLTQFKVRSLGCTLNIYLDKKYGKKDNTIWGNALPFGAREWLPTLKQNQQFSAISQYTNCVGAEALRTLRLWRVNLLTQNATVEESEHKAKILLSEVCYHRELGNQRYVDDLATHSLLNIHWPNLADTKWIDSELIPYLNGEWTDWRVNKALDVRQQMVVHNQDVGILERFGADIDLVEKILEDVSEAKNRCGLTTGAGSAVSDSETA